jgi:RNA polymerase sigma-54 factor
VRASAQLISDLLKRRKTTLERIVSIILVHQAKFFYGAGGIQPLKMQDIADELGFNQSTISRAVANKYVESQRGIFPLKEFFSFAIKDNISTNEVKTYINRLVKVEDKTTPLNDLELLELVKDKFSINLVRRSIAKYRQELNIPSSNERKKLYTLMSA